MEFNKLENSHIGVMVFGDLNIHNKRWLKCSSHTSTTGRQLPSTCHRHHLTELVHEATRGDHLLYLSLSTSQHCTKSEVLSSLADNKMVLTRCSLTLPQQSPIHVQCTVSREGEAFSNNSNLQESARDSRRAAAFAAGALEVLALRAWCAEVFTAAACFGRLH